MTTKGLEVHRFWATTLYVAEWADHERHAEGIVRHVRALRDGQSDAIASAVAVASKSAEGLTEGTFDLFDTEAADLAALREFARGVVAAAVSHANGGTVPPDRLDVRFTDSWFHITRTGGFHDAHGHGGCSWCGIYYVRAGASGPSDGGAAPNGLNRFYSPVPIGGAFRDYGNRYLERTYVDPPARDGLLIVFPSYLTHAALPYRGEAERIVIAFNTTTSLARR
jgi:uncharacterized protein (TIGR02466 family)